MTSFICPICNLELFPSMGMLASIPFNRFECPKHYAALVDMQNDKCWENIYLENYVILFFLKTTDARSMYQPTYPAVEIFRYDNKARKTGQKLLYMEGNIPILDFSDLVSAEKKIKLLLTFL